MKISTIVKYVAVALILLWSLGPIYALINMSFMFRAEIYAKPAHIIVQEPTLTWYEGLFGMGERPSAHAHIILSGILNSVYVALPTAGITIAVASVVGYALGRFRFRFKNALVLAMIMTMAVPPISTLIPYFVLFQDLGLSGTVQGLVLIYLTLTIPLLTWVLMGFFATLPIEVERAARIDGCSRLMAFRKVIFPMAAPGIASAAIIAFLLSWNEFVFALILNAGTAAGTLPPALSGLFFQDTPIPEMSAAVALSFIPPIAMALILQRYITRLRIVDPVTVITL